MTATSACSIPPRTVSLQRSRDMRAGTHDRLLAGRPAAGDRRQRWHRPLLGLSRPTDKWVVARTDLARHVRPVFTRRPALAVLTGDDRTLAPDTVTVWDVETGRPRGKLAVIKEESRRLRFHLTGPPSRRPGPTGSYGSGTPPRFRHAMTSSTGPARPSPSRPTAAIWPRHTRTGTSVIWDARDACQVGLLKGHRERRLAGCLFAGWPVTSHGRQGLHGQALEPGGAAGRRRGPRSGETSTPVWSLACSPDGKALAVADGPLGCARHHHPLGPGNEKSKSHARRASARRGHGRVFAGWKAARIGG